MLTNAHAASTFELRKAPSKNSRSRCTSFIPEISMPFELRLVGWLQSLPVPTMLVVGTRGGPGGGSGEPGMQ
jgi:hypothetical protein